MTSGTTATLRSLLKISLGMPMVIFEAVEFVANV